MTQKTTLAATNKVALVTVAFWVMKICATTLGETAGDQLSMTIHVGYAVLVLGSILLAAVVLTSVKHAKSTAVAASLRSERRSRFGAANPVLS